MCSLKFSLDVDVQMAGVGKRRENRRLCHRFYEQSLNVVFMSIIPIFLWSGLLNEPINCKGVWTVCLGRKGNVFGEHSIVLSSVLLLGYQIFVLFFLLYTAA